MAIASPSAPSFCCTTRSESSHRRFARPISTWFGRSLKSRVFARPAITSRLNASSDGELVYELNYNTHRRRRGAFPVYVTLPSDVVDPTAQTMRRKRAMAQSFRALAASGVEGVVMEVWWGLVEREFPRRYNWQGYLEIVEMAKRFGLKIRAVMAFHQCGSGPADPFWIPLPLWVLEEMDKDPDISYADSFGRTNMEYISPGCDILPILYGRSPIQAYTDLMRNFRDTFRPYLGGIITGIQVGLGPRGELRYPLSWPSREIGEFQSYDKYMLASINAYARECGNRLENTAYGEFFLGWHLGMLLLHGERICREAESIFRGNKVNMSGKVAGVHWQSNAQSHPPELTSNTRDGFTPIIRMFGRYGFTVCCSHFEVHVAEEQQITPPGNSFLRQVVVAARTCDVPLEGENYTRNLNDDSFQRVLRNSKFYSDGLETPSFSFNFVRMDKNLFEPRNWVSFTRFVRQMSAANMFQGSLDFGGGNASSSSPSASAFGGAVLAY